VNIEVDISDLIVLDRRLSGAGPVIQRHLVSGVDKAGKLIEGGAKGIVPVRTGHLRRNITSSARATSGGAQAIVAASTPYARFVEEGRGPVVASPGKVLRFTIGSQVIYRKRVGPARGRWYMRTAFQRNQAGAVRLVRQAGQDAAYEIIGGL
jgi:hypothetical protein